MRSALLLADDSNGQMILSSKIRICSTIVCFQGHILCVIYGEKRMRAHEGTPLHKKLQTSKSDLASNALSLAIISGIQFSSLQLRPMCSTTITTITFVSFIAILLLNEWSEKNVNIISIIFSHFYSQIFEIICEQYFD